MAEQSPWIIEGRAETFQNDVLVRSEEVPVVIDFWAPWCGPCQQLTPILHKLAEEYRGRFVLVTVNTEEQQELAAAFRVQSIPWVVAFQNGQPVDQFMGLLPEPQIREWLDALMPSPGDEALRAAQALLESDPREAETKLRHALELSPDDDRLRVALAQALLRQGRLDECRALITRLEERGFLEPEAEKIKSELDVRQTAAEAGGVEEARKAAEAHPDDLSLQLKLADALAASQQHEKALQLCLDVLQQDRSGSGEEARATMVKIFDMLGPGSELAGDYRRKLATALY